MVVTAKMYCVLNEFDGLSSIGHIDNDDIQTKLSKLTKRLDEVKLEVYETLQRKYDEFYPDLKTAMHLHDRSEALSKEMDSMATKIESEVRSIHFTLYYILLPWPFFGLFSPYIT